MMPFQSSPRPTGATSIPKLGFNQTAGAGRPAKIGKFAILRQPGNQSGFEWSKQTEVPDMLKQATDAYMGGGVEGLPSGLAPRRVRTPQPIEQRRRKSISAGWRNPRGAA